MEKPPPARGRWSPCGPSHPDEPHQDVSRNDGGQREGDADLHEVPASWLEAILAQSGFRIVERRARTSFCGPYVDVLFRVLPFEQALCRMNNRLADLLPFRWAADWMFLVEPQGKSPA